jgi:hypothetical protein
MIGRAVLPCLVWALLGTGGAAGATQTVWHFDNLKRVGGFKVEPEGNLRIVRSPVGKALQFDGKHDSLYIAGRPLVGASTFTVEAIFRPEGGPFEQRFMHIAETDPETGLDAMPGGTRDSNPRFMFEVRVIDNRWYLDTFVNSKAGSRPLIFKDKQFPLNRWYAVAQTYDGKTYRAYVDGVLQGEADVAFTPHGPGHVRIGARMNRIDYFTGSIAEARFTDHALPPEQLLKVAN